MASVDVIYVMCIGCFIQIGAFIMFNAVSGTGAVKITVLVECISLFIYANFVWFVIAMQRPTPAVAWVAEIVYQVVVAILCLSYLCFGNWRNKKI